MKYGAIKGRATVDLVKPYHTTFHNYHWLIQQATITAVILAKQVNLSEVRDTRLVCKSYISQLFDVQCSPSQRCHR